MQPRCSHIANLTMDVDSLEFLLSPEGKRLLQEADRLLTDENSHLRAISELRKSYSAPLAAAGIETVLLRRRAKKKFSRANEMFFTIEALEQSSGETVSAYRARRFAGYEHLADMPCGIGGDLIHLAKLSPTLAVERDPLLIRMAEINSEVYGVRHNIEFHIADLEDMEVPDVQAVWFDPSRRLEGRRKLSLQAYSPPVPVMLERWLPKVSAIGVKVAPAVSYDEIPKDCEAEFISDSGELKEAVFWFGPFNTAGRRATLLPQQFTLVDDPVAHIPVQDPAGFLYEPDPAVIRAHLVEQLAARIGAWKIGEETAYLCSENLQLTSFARIYKIDEVLPFNLKKLQAKLHVMGVGRVVIKRRGSPVEPIEIEPKLKLEGDREVTVVLTRSKGRSIAIICRLVGKE